jgi:hypothetical protein
MEESSTPAGGAEHAELGVTSVYALLDRVRVLVTRLAYSDKVRERTVFRFQPAALGAAQANRRPRRRLRGRCAEPSWT